MTDKSELQLVESARNGNTQSFGLLYQRYYGTMVWIAYSILNDRGLAEDAAQETFALACSQLARLRQVQKFALWLAGICRNVACGMARQRKKHVFPGDLSGLDKNDDTDNNEEIEQIIQQAISNLPGQYRDVLILYYYDDLSYERIAGILGIPSHRVKSRLFRARKKIAKYLDQIGFKWEQL